MDKPEQISEETAITERLVSEVKNMPVEKKRLLLKEIETTRPKNVRPEDKRRHPRKQCNIDVSYTCGGAAGQELIRDISLGGVFIETTETFYTGQIITLSIPFSNQNRKIRIKGRVVRVAQNGIGVEFDKNSVDTE